jgi:hypothetical protein
MWYAMRNRFQFLLVCVCILIYVLIKVVSSNSAHGKVYLIQRYVMKFVSDLQQVGGFLRFSSPMSSYNAVLNSRGQSKLVFIIS